METDRWKQDEVEEIIAIPRMPNPANNSQKEVKSEREMNKEEDKKYEGVRGCGKDLPEAVAQERLYAPRNFKITRGILGKYGRNEGCPRCRQSQNDE